MSPMESKLLRFILLISRNMFKQTKMLICVMVYIVEKNVTFLNEGSFSLTSSVQEVHVIF